MSKKESEFDRYERMKKMERQFELTKKRANDDAEDEIGKKKGKPKGDAGSVKKSRAKDYQTVEEDYDYV